MGLPGRRPILPAPTESLVDSGVEDTGLSTDIATDISRRTDRTSATIPDDGSPVTITTGIKGKPKTSKSGNQSQTSLLIEYFEGPKEPGSNRRPSLRVRVRPSAKSRDKSDGYLAVTQEQGSRKPSYTRRIPLGSKAVHSGSVSSLDSVATELRPGSAPIDIEIQGKDGDMSERSASPEPRFIPAPSDISSMPPDSILGTAPFTTAAAAAAIPAASSVLSRSDVTESSELRPPVIPRERNLSHERITQKAIEKLSNKERETSRSHRSSEKSRSRSRSITQDGQGGPSNEPRRRTTKSYIVESSISGGTESLVSNSLLSAGGKSIDDKSVRSGASNITNPKLLQTVEDAIRRLILPELKEIKRNGSQRVRRREEYYSDVSDGSSIAREKASARKVSSGGRSKRRTSKGSGSGSRRRDGNQELEHEYRSASEASSHRRDSISSVSTDHDGRHRSNEKGTRARDIAAGALTGGALTAAALHHQDSSSTMDRRQRRKRSKSQSSKSASVAESEDTFEKHAVPPMPFRSEVDSELTRSSLLSSNTANTATPTQREVREVIRGSPLDGRSPVISTQAQTPGDLRHTLGTHHRNVSGHDLTAGRNSFDEQAESRSAGEYSPESYHGQPFESELLADPERLKAYERNLHQQHPIRRGLSPIQSVASYATTEPNRYSTMHARSIDSMSSAKRRERLKEEVSMDSFMSASPSMRKSVRPHGVNLENREDVLHQHDDSLVEDEREIDEFYDEQHNQNELYRDSFASEDPKVDIRHLTNYTDDSMDGAYLDKVASGQQVAQGFGANPEYVHTPPGVESAVASLIEPSLLETAESPHQSVIESAVHERGSTHSLPRDVGVVKASSPLKEQVSISSPNSFGKTRNFSHSPPQSPAHSFEENQEDIINTPQAEHKSVTSPESEIETNPSVIRGPIGELSAGNRDHWPYAATPERAMPNNPAQQALSRDLGIHAPDLIPEALKLSQRQTYDSRVDLYSSGDISPPGAKDEGYATGDNPRSPGIYAQHNKGTRTSTPDDLMMSDDPFTTKRNQYASGLSQGMSPLYDSATGRGIDRIQSKDIVALMDHLTVRDAQRNARDTEILVTLVRSAAEMRNSFEEMKKFIAEQDGLIVNATEKQHEKTQRIIGGPRPQPVSSRTPKSMPSQEDLPAKRRNIFKRALQGLGSKNATELHNIEQMLMQLLDDVEGLRVLQTGGPSLTMAAADEPRSLSVGSTENARAPTDQGYEPEGQAGTSSTGDRSGFLSNQSSRQEYRISSGRRDSANRVSTVMEGDEEDYDDYDDGQADEVSQQQTTPRASEQYRHSRGQSVPVATPPRMHEPVGGNWSQDNTPQYGNEPPSGRKHKSIASNFLPKGLISRWSKTTTSTEPRFSSQVKPRPYSHVSRSGSDLAEYTYDPQPEDRLRSNTSLANEEYRDQENRPPSPLVPSQVSEKPKYQGYRNSQNLEHPQPRQGPTGRYQSRLENEARTYDDAFSPTSQTSSQWANQLDNRNSNTTSQGAYQPQPPLSPISDTGYSEMSDRRSSTSSRRHTRIEDDPLVPQRPPKIPMSPSTYVDHVSAARAGSPAYDKVNTVTFSREQWHTNFIQSPVSALRSPQGTRRTPSGPRAYNAGATTGAASQGFRGDLNSIKRNRYRGSPFHVSSEEDVTHDAGV